MTNDHAGPGPCASPFARNKLSWSSPCPCCSVNKCATRAFLSLNRWLAVPFEKQGSSRPRFARRPRGPPAESARPRRETREKPRSSEARYTYTRDCPELAALEECEAAFEPSVLRPLSFEPRLTG